jgi:CheY-specific phosphatase CheX
MASSANGPLNQAVREATLEMFESVLAKTAEGGAPQSTAAASRSYETSVVISFVGSVSGAFALRCSRKMAAKVASQMLGTDVAEGSDDMKDAIGEFFNMIVGAAKTKYPSTAEPFKISVPTTIIGDDYVLHIKANASEELSLLEFRCDGDTLSVEVYIK